MQQQDRMPAAAAIGTATVAEADGPGEFNNFGEWAQGGAFQGGGGVMRASRPPWPPL